MSMLFLKNAKDLNNGFVGFTAEDRILLLNCLIQIFD